MKLLIEIGNTSLKWALLEGTALGPMTAARHFGALPIDVLANWETLARIERVLVASVGPESVLEAVRATVEAYWQCPLQRIEPVAQAHAVRVAYADPRRLGVDRFLALIGAYWLEPEPVESGRAPEPERGMLIIDAGTAITFDGLLADGTHRGGQILPGITMLRDSLLQGTRLSPHHTQDRTERWGQDTGPAITAASLHAPAALGERLRETFKHETGRAPRVILTGGDAERLAPLFQAPVQLQPDLVLHGLARFG
ncbi:type III pantothenate kinase [Halochromatium salexigens]|uniref:Type III pantothenate kinase n=1 Tax=Halochromatium salexigens TaxID=49447 RepID=A0AAJ0XEB0_HALSE|nr:hypothetical protein [Halochromatium salexigens]